MSGLSRGQDRRVKGFTCDGMSGRDITRVIHVVTQSWGATMEIWRLVKADVG